MWKKVIPVAAVLILAWIGLNLITAKDEEESVAHAPDAATTEVTESVEAEAVHLTENVMADTTPETAPADEKPADVAEVIPADEEPAADAVISEEATDTAEATTEETGATEATEATDTAEVTETADATDATEVAADTTETSADASGSTLAMRYPTDPVTGATIYDQGKVEVVIEPTVEPVEEETETASEQSTDTTEPAAEEVAATEPEEIVEPVMVNRVAMRYPTDPVTGATIFDQGMVEVEFESVVEPGEEIAEAAPDQAAEGSDASETVEVKSNAQMRYPTDPVTGATLYDQGMIEVEIESDAEPVDEVAESAADQVPEASDSAEEKSNAQMRYPTDPVTGATLYDQGMIEVEIESDTEVEEVAESADDQAPETAESAENESNAQMRYPTDPVTGATVYDQGMVEVVIETAEDEVAADNTESSSEAATETAASEAPAEPTSDTATEDSAEAEVVTEVAESDAATTTGAVAAIAERGTFSLGAISRTLGGVFGTTTTVLSTARDEASAQAVLPRLEAASSSLNAVVDQYATLPEYAKGPLGKVIKRGMARLKPLADTALTREGVGPVLMPVMGPMLESMQAMLR